MLSKEENLKRLKRRIAKLDIPKKTVLAFDFDELAVPIHLAREITKETSSAVDEETLEKLGPCSFEGIMYLRNLLEVRDLEKYTEIRDKIAKETKWTLGFDDLINKLGKKYSVIFISSGMKDRCYAKLKELNFNPNNIIGGEQEIEKRKIIGTKMIITDELKGLVVKEIKKNHSVIAIGHSLGDKFMLENADISISLNSDVEGLADYNVTSSEELFDLINKISK